MLPSDESGVVTEAQLPEEFSIDWVDRGEAFTYDAETAEKSQKKAAEITNERNKKSEKLAETIAETKNRYMEEYAKTNNLTYTEDPNFDVSEYILVQSTVRRKPCRSGSQNKRRRFRRRSTMRRKQLMKCWKVSPR